MKINLKLIRSFFSVLFVASLMMACSKDGQDGAIGPRGPEGPSGPQGDQGEQADPGTANVIYSPWTASGFETPIDNSFGSFTIDAPELTEDIVDNGVVLVYGIDQVDDIHPLPVTLYGILSNENYSFRFEAPGSLEIDVNEINGNDVNFPYMHNVYRYVIIPGSIPTTSKTALKMDYTKMSYVEIAERFDIPD